MITHDLGELITRLNITMLRVVDRLEVLIGEERKKQSAPYPVIEVIEPVPPERDQTLPQPQRPILWARIVRSQVVPGTPALTQDFSPPFSGRGLLMVQVSDAAVFSLSVEGNASAVNEGVPLVASSWYSYEFPMAENVGYNVVFDTRTRVSLYGLLLPQ